MSGRNSPSLRGIERAIVITMVFGCILAAMWIALLFAIAIKYWQ